MEVDPLVMRLRAMARYKHDDLSIGEEAADRIEMLEQRSEFFERRLYAALRRLEEE